MQTSFLTQLIGNWSLGCLALWFFASYLYHGLGITLGYHRLLTHRALILPKWLSYAIVSGGYLCLQGSPIVWVGVHRLHHQKSDLPGDPHSPLDGFWHALYQWMFKMHEVQSDQELQTQTRDLMQDPIYKWLGCTHTADQAMRCLKVNIAFRLLILVFFGAGAMVANTVAMLIVFVSTQLVNAACHVKAPGAYRNFETRDQSLNVWWVGILALGEGWHNNHHAIPSSARHGMKWWELDVTWYTTWLLEKVGLATKIIRPTQRLALAAANIEIEEEPAQIAGTRR